MAGDDQGRDLVAELVGRERLAGLRVARGDQHVEQVARRVGRRGAAALGDDAVEHVLERPAGAVAQPGQRVVRLGREQEVEEGRPGQPAAVALDRGPDRRPVLAHRLREEGAAGDLERQPLHRAQHVDRPRRAAPQVGHQPTRELRHLDGDQVEGARGEGRRDEAPLVTPGGPFGEKQPLLTEQRADDPQGRRCSAVGRVVVHEHAPDRVGRVDDHALAAEEAPAHHVQVIGGLAPGADRVAPELEQDAPERQGCRRPRRQGGYHPCRL